MSVSPQLMEILRQVAAKAAPVVQSQGMPRVGAAQPGRVGGPPPVVAPGPPVAPGAPVQPGAPIGTTMGVSGMQPGMQSRNAPLPGTPLPGNPDIPIPAPQTSGFAFQDKATARAATVHDAITNLVGVVNKYKQESSQKTERRAEVLTRSLYDAIDRGDNEAINELLSDSKNLKTLEKAGIGVPPEIKKVEAPPKAEPPTPEQQGVHKAAQQWAIRGKPTGQQQAQFNQGQVAQAATGQQVADVTAPGPAGVDARRAVATGTTMSPTEQHDAERWAAGVTMSPVMLQTFDAQQKQHAATLGMEYAKINSQMESVLHSTGASVEVARLEAEAKKLESQNQTGIMSQELDVRKKEAEDKLAEAKLYRGAEISHWDMMKDLQEKRLDLEKQIRTARDKTTLFQGFKAMSDSVNKHLQTLTGEINAYNKLGTSAGREQAAKLQPLADSLSQNLRNISAMIENSQATDTMNSIMSEPAPTGQ